MNFLKKFISRFTRKKALKWTDIENMPFTEFLYFAKERMESHPDLRELLFLERRFIEIGLYDHHVPDEHRIGSLQLAKSLKEAIETGGKDSPEWLEGARAARASLLEMGPQYGSLSWLIEEHRIPGNQMASYMIHPERAHLIKEYFRASSEISRPEIVLAFRQEVILQLIVDRAVPSSKNAVLILHALAMSQDPAMRGLFDEVQLKAFRNAHRNYGPARAVLVDLGILPPATAGFSFEPVISTDHANFTIVMAAKTGYEPWEEPQETTSFLSSLDEEHKSGFQLARSILSMHLGMLHLEAIHADKAPIGFRSAVKATFSGVPEFDFEPFWERLEQYEQVAFESGEWSPDLLLLADLLQYSKGELSKEYLESEMPFLTEGGKLLSIHRAAYLERFRFNLRFFAAQARGENPEDTFVNYQDDWLF